MAVKACFRLPAATTLISLADAEQPVKTTTSIARRARLDLLEFLLIPGTIWLTFDQFTSYNLEYIDTVTGVQFVLADDNSQRTVASDREA